MKNKNILIICLVTILVFAIIANMSFVKAEDPPSFAGGENPFLDFKGFGWDDSVYKFIFGILAYLKTYSGELYANQVNVWQPVKKGENCLKCNDFGTDKCI